MAIERLSTQEGTRIRVLKRCWTVLTQTVYFLGLLRGAGGEWGRQLLFMISYDSLLTATRSRTWQIVFSRRAPCSFSTSPLYLAVSCSVSLRRLRSTGKCFLLGFYWETTCGKCIFSAPLSRSGYTLTRVSTELFCEFHTFHVTMDSLCGMLPDHGVLAVGHGLALRIIPQTASRH